MLPIYVSVSLILFTSINYKKRAYKVTAGFGGIDHYYILIFRSLFGVAIDITKWLARTFTEIQVPMIRYPQSFKQRPLAEGGTVLIAMPF